MTFDGEKKTQSRKRHIGVEILDCLLNIHCHAANLSGTKKASLIMDRLINKYPSIRGFAGDGGYRGTAVDYALTQLNRELHVAVELTGKYVPMSMRRVVNRTFGWITKARRLVRDYEVVPGNSENIVRISMLKIVLAKIA